MTHIFNRSDQNDLRKKLRNEPTEAEVFLWQKLKNKQLNGYKFRRQYGIGEYVVDFYCVEARLAIEVDGPIHDGEENAANDADRQKNIEALALRIIRFTMTIFF